MEANFEESILLIVGHTFTQVAIIRQFEPYLAMASFEAFLPGESRLFRALRPQSLIRVTTLRFLIKKPIWCISELLPFLLYSLFLLLLKLLFLGGVILEPKLVKQWDTRECGSIILAWVWTSRFKTCLWRYLLHIFCFSGQGAWRTRGSTVGIVIIVLIVPTVIISRLTAA